MLIQSKVKVKQHTDAKGYIRNYWYDNYPKDTANYISYNWSLIYTKLSKYFDQHNAIHRKSICEVDLSKYFNITLTYSFEEASYTEFLKTIDNLIDTLNTLISKPYHLSYDIDVDSKQGSMKIVFNAIICYPKTFQIIK